MLFRKQISVLLVFFLLVSNLGLAINVHYCADEIASITLNSTLNNIELEKECCGIVEKDSKCCKNKLVKSLEKIDQVLVKSITFFDYFIQIPTQTLNFYFTKTFFYKSKLVHFYCDANAPPFYILYSQFTFYA